MSRVAELKDQVNRISFASFHTDLADTLTQQLRQQALLGDWAALQAALPEEVAAYRDCLRTAARAAARTPSTFRCAGHYHRGVLTTYGLIPDLRVAKLRSANAERPWQVLKRYQLAMQLVLAKALYLYTLGLSRGDLQEALYLVFGQVLSREAVGRVSIAAQSPLQLWRERPITDTPPRVIVDGVWLQILAATAHLLA